eukprot:gene1846-biopygen6453
MCSFGYTRLPETLRPEKVVDDTGRTRAPQRRSLRQHAAAWWRVAAPLIADRRQQGLIAQACVFPLPLGPYRRGGGGRV